MSFVFPSLPLDSSGKVARVLQAALSAADPRATVRAALEVDPILLRDYSRVRVVGLGKASPGMTLGLLDVLGEDLSAGLIVTKHAEAEYGLPGQVRVLPGGHPVPTAESAAAAEELLAFLANSRADDLTFCLISGGGSALVTAPQPPVTLEDLQALTRLLLACGADITEMNTLRKHLDRIKGGGLARAAAPARLVTLILSDVIGSPLDVIASGPTVADTTTYTGALAVLRKYGIEERVPESIRAVLRDGAAGRLPETVKPGDPALARVTNMVVASNVQAAEAALAQAQREGFHTRLLTTALRGEAAQVGTELGELLRELAAGSGDLPRPACLIAGGETTVTLRGSGLGGRNQELALGAVTALSGAANVALVTLATDGEDGPTNAAGAIVTGETLARDRALGLDPQAYLQNNDSYAFFAALGDLLRPGPTGTNVNDLTFLFAF